MATTIKTYVGDGTQTIYTFEFDYLSNDFVKVLVNGAYVGFTLTQAYQVTLDVAPAASTAVIVQRETSKDRIVDFVDGSVLIAKDLNIAAIQAIHIAAEADDRAAGSLLTDESGAYTAGFRRIADVGDPTAPRDVVNKSWAETAMSSQLALATAQADAALARKEAAAASAVAAAASQAAALVSENNAFTSEGGALTSANNAASSRQDAAVDAGIASSASTSASTSATEALASEVAAAASAVAASDDATALSVAIGTVTQFSGRNLIINGSGRVNQRGYASGTATATANKFTLDRWYVIQTGQNLTFTGDGSGRVMTAPVGGAATSVGASNVVGGTYVLSYTGTATCQVNGVSRASGDSFTLPASTAVKVVFFSGTFTDVQLELGTAPTAFEFLNYGVVEVQCKRYYQTLVPGRFTGLLFTPNGDTRLSFRLPQKMRTAPVIAQTGTTSVLAVGHAAALANVSLGTLNVSNISQEGFDISSCSNFAAFSSAGNVVAFGDHGFSLVTFYLEAEIVL